MKSKTLALGLAAEALILITASASGAAADDPPPPNQGTPSSEGDGAPSGPGVTVVQVPSAGPGYPGYLPPAGWDPNGHLPSSSRGSTDISRSSDGFDLLPKSEGGGSFRGSSNGAYVSGGGGVSGGVMPEAHNVRRGDTLWDISTRYYQNPYEWPRVWSYNPQIQNPHWIYPGDRIHLRDPGDASSSSSSSSARGSLGGVSRGGRRADTGTIFFGDVGWVDDKKDDTWGELVGSPSDRMMLGEGDDVYVQLDEGHEAQVGDKLTIFRPIRTVATKDAKGELVSIRGTARIDRYNPKTRMIRARVLESLDVIERGVKVGPVVRQIDKRVQSVSAEKDIEAHILASIYPHQLFGQNQVVFIDKGEKDGVKVGQRFFAIRRGDRWAESAPSAGPMAVKRPRVEDDRPAQIDPMRVGVDEALLPDETYAELRVVRMRDHTATALVTQSKHEVERNARLVSRKGM
jgi:LysM domain